ncbi:MAG: hypothetical protein ACK4OK_01075, partial [Thermoflexus sp.]
MSVLRVWRDWRTRSARFRASLLSPGEIQDPHLRRNFTVGVVNGALFIFAETILDPNLVLVWFLSRLGAPNF